MANRSATSRLGVLGGAPEAVQHALLVRQWSPDVILFHHTGALTPEQREQLTARGVRIIEGTVARLVADDDRLQGVELAGGAVIARTAVFVRPRFVPNADLVDEDVERARSLMAIRRDGVWRREVTPPEAR